MSGYRPDMGAWSDGGATAFRGDLEYYEERARGLLDCARDGAEGPVTLFHRWEAPLSESGARLVVAREHGLASWEDFGRHLASLRTEDPFVRAYHAVESHDVEGLQALIERHPELVRARATNDNDLLGMAAATCDERLVAVLLDRGADPAHANVYGWTALHQAAYGGLTALARMLLATGASIDVAARGDGGTPLVVALFWGHRETADLLAEHAVVPPNLRAAHDSASSRISRGSADGRQAGKPLWGR